MALVYLTDPFVKHYAGTIFSLEKGGESSVNYEDMWFLEKLPNVYNQSYHLPDDGKGRPTQLPIYMTKECSLEAFEAINIQSGPVRITSVSEGIFYDNGIGNKYSNQRINLSYHNLSKIYKNSLEINQVIKPRNLKIEIINKQNTEIKHMNFVNQNMFKLDFSPYPPGFYDIKISAEEMSEVISLIKLFPIFIDIIPQSSSINYKATIW
jgi:hypothetical protein